MAIREGFVLLLLLLLPVSPAAQTAADADFDGSGTVDFADFLAFVSGFGTDRAVYDLSADGTVDLTDFLTFVQMFGLDRVGPDAETYRFPLTVGNRWTYAFTGTLGNESASGTVTWEVTGRTEVRGWDAHEVTIRVRNAIPTLSLAEEDSAKVWFAHTDTELRQVLDEGRIDLGVPSVSQLYKRTIAGASVYPLNLVEMLQTELYSESRVLQYPFGEKASWKSSEEVDVDHVTILNLYTYIGGDRVRVPAGTFDCHKIGVQLAVNLADDLRTENWYSADGLVKRQVDLGEQVRTDEQGQVLGTFRDTFTMELVEFTLK